MKQILNRVILAVVLFLIPGLSNADPITLMGTITNSETNLPLPGVSITIKNSVNTASSDQNGKFHIALPKLPAVIVFSYLGFSSKEVTVNDNANLAISLSPQLAALTEVVITASRVEEKIMQSPVSIEKMDLKAIKETPAMNFYDGLQNLKSVDVVASSLTFKSINSRGFSGIGTGRLLQLVDGVDNQAPGLNFSVGNLFGLSDLDAESAELIPGAASALYGPSAFNGVLMLRSKDAFKYQGLSVQSKLGVNHINDQNTGSAPIYDVAVRYAKAFNNKLAFKTNLSYIKGLDWYAADYTDIDLTSAVRGNNNPGKNLLNVYGDEVYQDIMGIGRVSRTGYEDKDLADHHVKSVKLNGALNYKIARNLEAGYQYNYGKGTANYTGSSRFSINNYTLQQHRLELKGSNFFLRGYATIENSGDSYNSLILSKKLNQAWVRDLNGNPVSPYQADNTWFQRYIAAYNSSPSANVADKHTAARAFADEGRFLPGSAAFESAKNTFKGLQGADGAQVFSASKIYHLDGQYDFSKHVKVVDVLVGGNIRKYAMNTNGTLFADKDKKINIGEGGVFVQASKRLFEEKLKLVSSLRYDKNQNFKGSFTPRASAVYSPSLSHNFRASYQTGFRNPTPADQYINLPLGTITVVGGVPSNSAGTTIYQNSYTANSVGAFGAAFGAAMATGADFQTALMSAKNLLQKSDVAYIKPEHISSYEIGYKGILKNKLMIDFNYYISNYKDFILNEVVISPESPVLIPDGSVNPGAAADILSKKMSVYQLFTNASDKVSARGSSLGLTYYLPKKYVLSGNTTWSELNLKNADPKKIPAFNTPEYIINLSLANSNVYKNVGFNMNYRWQSGFDWIASFTDLQPGHIGAYSQLNAQVSYKLPTIKSMVKVGATNLTNKYVSQAYGSPAVGGVYYISITFDDLLK